MPTLTMLETSGIGDSGLASLYTWITHWWCVF